MMLLLVVLSAALLGSAHSLSAAGSPAATPDTASAIIDGIAEASLQGAERTISTEVRTELQRAEQEVQKQVTSMQQQVTERRLIAVQLKLLELLQQLDSEGENGTTLSEGCPVNWLQLDRSCYLLSTESSTGHRAEQACAALDRRAHLLSVHPANQRHVHQLMQESGERWVWIGLRRLSGDDNWGWTDGTPLDMTNWFPPPTFSSLPVLRRQPDNYHGLEDCVVMWPPFAATWHDKQCASTSRYMCQISLD